MIMNKIEVVTTFAPLYSFALNVAGDQAEVPNLVPIGASVHVYQSKPSDVKKIAEADVLIKNGVHLEESLDDMTRKKTKEVLLRLCKMLVLLRFIAIHILVLVTFSFGYSSSRF